MATKGASHVLMAVCVVMGVVGLARGETVVLAHTGQGAPGGNGTYSTFRDPVLNAFGRIAFKGFLAGTAAGYDDDTAIFRADAGGGTVIYHEGWMTPDANGWFTTLYDPAMNNASQVAFRGDASGTLLGVYDAIGIYRGSGGALDRIFRGNELAPDGNGRFLVMDDEVVFDDDVATVCWASFTGTAGGYTDDTAIVVNGWGISRIAAREGQWVPSGNGRFSGFRDIAANKDQNIAFLGDMRNTSAGSDNNTAIFSARPWYSGVNLVELVREGDAPPDGNGEYQSFSLSPTLDNVGNGRIGFHAWLRNTIGGTDDDSGIFLAMDAGVVRIAREALSPPDGNGQYSNFDSDIAQNDSWVAFRAFMRNTSGGSADEEGLYRGNGFITRKIVRGGEPAPDGNGVFRYFWDIVMNKAGHVAFFAQLPGTAGGTSDNVGLFIGDGFDTVQVARKSDPLLGSTIAELHLATGPDCRNGLNQHAQVAYRAVLADGREALVLFTPELEWKGGSSGSWAAKANWTLSILPDDLYEVAIGPRGSVDIAGPRSEARVKSLTIGSISGGTAALNLTYGGGLTALEDVTIGADGLILLGAGRTLSAAALLNQGTLAFEAGLGDVLGDVTNSPGGQILVPPSADVWLHDLLENEGVLDVGPGGVVNLAELLGNGCTGAGTTRLEGHVRPGLGIGQMGFEGDVILGPGSAMHIELGGLVAALEHDQVLVGGDLMLDGLLRPTLVRPFGLELGQHFEIMDVGGTSAGQFRGLGEGDVVGNYGGLDLFITYAAGDGNDVALFTIPEPASALVLVLGVLVLLRRRRCGVAATATGAERYG